jgi:hypothetical protein
VARFLLPEQLPVTVDELQVLLSTCRKQINLIRARVDAGEELSTEDVGYLRELITARDTLTGEIDAVTAAETQHREELADLLERAADTAPAETEPQTAQVADDEPPASADTPPPAVATLSPSSVEVVDVRGFDTPPQITMPDLPATPPDQLREVVAVGPGGGGTAVATREAVGTALVARGGDNRPVNFSGLGVDERPALPAGPGWRMRPGAPGYVEGPVGFNHIGRAIDSVAKHSRKVRNFTAQARGSYMYQTVADLKRDAPTVGDPHQLVEEIERATTTLPARRGVSERVPVTADSLIAAGGWCSPSEILYDFCDVPNATDLISVPEITIVRGGVRWPVEPDLTSIFESFEFFFTEPELEAVDADSFPIARKECVQIPCPDEFEEMRLNVVGYCVEAGILQTQGWPELITWFTQQLVQEHLRAISRRTILDMVAGSTLETFAGTYVFGAVGAILNSMALMASNLRLNRGLSRNAPIEAVAPSWLFEAIRADLAYHQFAETKAVDDATIQRWFAVRGISIQLVGDWQTRNGNEVGSLSTVAWPSYVDVLMYPAGTWFRAMQNVIELGVMYPKEELILNRYTRMFTEDALAVGSRCYPSVVARIPICVSGAVGYRQQITCASATYGQGALFSGAPIPGGASDFTQGNQYSITVTGTPTGGNFTLALTPPASISGSATAGSAIAFNAYGWQVSESLEGLFGFTKDDFFTYSTTTGALRTGQLPADVLVIQVPAGYTLSVSSTAFTGGSTPNASVAQVNVSGPVY